MQRTQLDCYIALALQACSLPQQLLKLPVAISEIMVAMETRKVELIQSINRSFNTWFKIRNNPACKHLPVRILTFKVAMHTSLSCLGPIVSLIFVRND